MTRRQIYFFDPDKNTYYLSGELNGDKEEFERFGSSDTCEKTWAEIAAELSIPVLRKDFTIDEYMIYETKILGGSAILLICSILSGEQIREYIGICDELGLSALVEAHDEAEAETALHAGARIIGVNNRNLKDFTVNVENSLVLRRNVPEDVIFVAESGIRTAEDIEKLRQGNVQAVLIGETLMRSPDKKKMLEELRGKRA